MVKESNRQNIIRVKNTQHLRIDKMRVKTRIKVEIKKLMPKYNNNNNKIKTNKINIIIIFIFTFYSPLLVIFFIFYTFRCVVFCCAR